MLARIFRFSTALFVSLAAWLHQPVVTISCGPYYDGEDVHITCFDPAVLPDSLYGGLFRLAIGDAVGLSSEDEFYWPKVRTFDQNIQEWGAYLGGRVPLEDIETFVYKDSAVGLVELLQSLKQGDTTIPDIICATNTAREIVRRNDTAMLRYMIFAKDCEWYLYNEHNSWWNDHVDDDPRTRTALIHRGQDEYATCPNKMLQLRYGYQLVRLAPTSEAKCFYESMVVNNPTASVIRFYAMQWHAADLASEGRKAESLYHMSLVFDKYNASRWTTLHDFNIDSAVVWDSTYALARNDHERSVLWMMRGLVEYKLDMKPIVEIVRLDPDDSRLDVMLLREVREVERRLYSARTTRTAGLRHVADWRPGAKYKNWNGERTEWWVDSTDDPRYPTQLARFAETCANGKRIPNRALWYAVAGYMRIIDGDFSTARRDLELASQTLEDNWKLERQIRALKLISRVQSDQYLPTKTVKRYIEAVQWLDRYRQLDEEHRKIKHHDWYFTNSQSHLSGMVLLGQKFLKQGDVPRAAAAFACGSNTVAACAVIDLYASDGDLLQLQRILEQPRQNSLDSILFDEFPFSSLQIMDVRATRMMRRGRFAEAVRLWDELDTMTPQQRTLSDIFSPQKIYSEGHFTATIDTMLPHLAQKDYKPQQREMTRPEFAREMLRLQQQSRRSRNDAERCNFTIARALFSTPYWGYNEQLWQGSLIWNMRFFYGPVNYPFNVEPVAERMVRAHNRFLREYGSNELAWSFFNRTRRVTGSWELAARCAYEMDRAKKDLQTSYHPRPENQDRTGYNLLRTRYRATDFAQDIMSNCVTYRQFRTHQ